MKTNERITKPCGATTFLLESVAAQAISVRRAQATERKARDIDMKFEKIVAELADKVKMLEMQGVTKSMLVRHLADMVGEVAE